jgi:hypothetical protein
MREPTLFRDRPRSIQIVLVGLIPFVFGAVVGVFLGISAGAYWALSALAAIAAVVAGFEHHGPRGGAIRGLCAGAIFAAGILIAHAIAGTHAKVSLGSFPPLLIVIDAVAGMLLSALGGLIGRSLWVRAAAEGDSARND